MMYIRKTKPRRFESVFRQSSPRVADETPGTCADRRPSRSGEPYDLHRGRLSEGSEGKGFSGRSFGTGLEGEDRGSSVDDKAVKWA